MRKIPMRLTAHRFDSILEQEKNTKTALDDPLTLELARLLEASMGKDEDSPETQALEAFILLLIEREGIGYAS